MRIYRGAPARRRCARFPVTGSSIARDGPGPASPPVVEEKLKVDAVRKCQDLRPDWLKSYDCHGTWASLAPLAFPC